MKQTREHVPQQVRIPEFPPQFYNPLAVWTWEDHFNFLVPCWVICDVKVAQSYPTFCNSMAYTIHRILQAGILEWVAAPFSRRSSQPRDWTQVSCIEGRFFTSWAIGKSWVICKIIINSLSPKFQKNIYVLWCKSNSFSLTVDPFWLLRMMKKQKCLKINFSSMVLVMWYHN